MRYQGRIDEWNDDRGFGFIEPAGGGRRVFLHVSSFSGRGRRPTVGSLVTYELVMDDSARVNPVVSVLGALLVLCFGGYVTYVRLSHPNSTVSASVYKIFSARDALQKHAEFQCEPTKSSCSRMKSCAEAFFHQERCGVSGMDGDRDGIPCEQQWCN